MLRVGMHTETDFRKLLQDATKLDPATEYGQIGDLVDALKRIDPDKLAEADRRELWKFYEAKRSLRLAVLRHKIIKEHAIDVLAKEVLGYKVQPFHLAMMQFQFLHRDNLQLCFRGAGKSVTCTITKAIWYLLNNRDLRLLIASKKHKNATKFLVDIKNHLESNRLLIELFGQFKDPNPKTNLKWNEDEIIVLGRTKAQKESSITCVGVDGSLAGGHFDVEFSDDIVDNKNSQTLEMRDKIESWYNSILDPCMEPADKEVPFRGDRNRLGTRYHYDDLYGRWIARIQEDKLNGHGNTMHVNIIPALDDDGRSPWPEKWAPSELMARRRKYGIIIFNSQYQCNTDAMKGAIIQIDDCQEIAPSKVMEMWNAGELRAFMGVDLAISEKETADKFAIVVLGMDAMKRYYVLEHFSSQLRFIAQTKKIVELWKKWDVERIGIEKNGYQGAQLQALKDAYPDIPLRAIQQDKDKVTRAHRLSAVFEQKRVFFTMPGNELLIEQIVLFPGYRYDDSFDAFDMAVSASKHKERKQRRDPAI